MQVERIGITQNYNNSSRPNFKAKFPASEIKSMAKDAREFYGAAGIPMLDVLLGYLEKIGGKVAHIQTKKEYAGAFPSSFSPQVSVNYLTIDGNVVCRPREHARDCGIDLLKKYIVGEPTKPFVVDFVRMPERIFESKWFEHGTRDEQELFQHAL